MFIALISYQEPVFRAETQIGERLKKLECDWGGLLSRTMRSSRLCSTWSRITTF